MVLVRGLGFWIMSFGISKWVIGFASGCSKLMVMEWFVMVCHGQVWHGMIYYGLPWYGSWESLGHAYKYADSWHNNSIGTSWHVLLHTYSLHIWSKLGTVQRCIFCWQICWQLTHHQHWDKLTGLSVCSLHIWSKLGTVQRCIKLTVDTSTALGPVDMSICKLSSYMKQTGNWCSFCIQISWQLTHQHVTLGQ